MTQISAEGVVGSDQTQFCFTRRLSYLCKVKAAKTSVQLGLTVTGNQLEDLIAAESIAEAHCSFLALPQWTVAHSRTADRLNLD